jgi:uncharacterized membrane protein YkvA (DUF1232 family)
MKAWITKIKKQIFILYLAYKDDRVAWYPKIFSACVVAYAFSPIDLIPDFIPILGYIDDFILVPLGIVLALKMLPQNVIDSCSEKAEELMEGGRPENWIVGMLIITIWGIVFMWISVNLYNFYT